MLVPSPNAYGRFVAAAEPRSALPRMTVEPLEQRCLFSLIASAIESEVLARFTSEDFVEGVVQDKAGNTYVTLGARGQLWRLDRDGELSLHADLGPPGPFGVGLLGLDADPRGNIYAAFWSGDPATHGVWKFDPAGNGTRLEDTAQIIAPDGLARDVFGNLYITDTVLGAVWKRAADGEVSLWKHDALLEGNGIFGQGFPIGANGIAVSQSQVVVAVTEGARVVTIPIEGDGSAGDISVLAEDFALLGIDGLAVDVFGNVYVPNVVTDSIIRIDRDTGELLVLAGSEDGLDDPLSVAFAKNGDLLVTNSAFLPDDPDRPGASLLRLDLDDPGDPL